MSSSTYDKIVETAQEIVDLGGRPWTVRMNESTAIELAADTEVPMERVKLSTGGRMTILGYPHGNMRIITDDRLGNGQFIVGRGWDVKS